MRHITLLQGKTLLIELPEGAKVIGMGYNGAAIAFETSMGHEWPLPFGNWRIIGMLSEVTDAELADVTGFYYNKYNERYVEMPTSAMRATPVGDIEDAIRAGGYTFQSTPKPENKDFYWGYLDDLAKWEAAQSRVLCRERCLLLGREGA